jgi:hypothetical protein
LIRDTTLERVPWDVLLSLHTRMPSSDLFVGAFAQIKLRVQKTFEDASKWQEDVTGLTNLSLRGGNRRVKSSTKRKCDSADDLDSSSGADFDKLVVLSNNPILSMVSVKSCFLILNISLCTHVVLRRVLF